MDTSGDKGERFGANKSQSSNDEDDDEFEDAIGDDAEDIEESKEPLVMEARNEPLNEPTESQLIQTESKSEPVKPVVEFMHEPERKVLPAQKDPDQKLSIWSVIKDSIG